MLYCKRMSLKILHADETANGATLVSFLAAQLQLSNKATRRIIDDRRVFVNNRRVWMARHRLATGDRIEVTGADRECPSVHPGRMRLLYQDEHLIVADKPAGLTTCGPDSLEDILRRQLKAPELRAVHRLDRDTTGCNLFATGAAGFTAMLPLFKEGRLTKIYQAIAMGRVPGDIKQISAPIAGEKALTLLKVLDSNATASHLKVKIESGRTHQIRRHLQMIRHPLLGDRQYFTGAQDLPLLRDVPRQMLHAVRLVFRNPLSGALVKAESPLPPDYRECLKRLRLE